MAHFAQLDENNIVTSIIVVDNKKCLDENGIESEEKGIEFCRQLLGENTNWVQTSYNNNFRVRYACIGFTYNKELDAFIPPKPYESWSLNENTYVWEPPLPLPTDEFDYVWDEDTISWKVVEIPNDDEFVE